MTLEDQNRTYHVAQSSMELLPAYYRWVYGKFLQHIHGRTVELGCGAALGLGTYLDRADEILAVDHNAELLARVRDTYPTPKVKPVQADLIADWAFMEEGTADTVLMMDVVEHFKDDQTLIRRAASLLAPGGTLLIKVPAQPALYSSVDEASGHYRRYDDAGLKALADNAGLSVQWIKKHNVIGALGYRMKRGEKTNFSRTFSPGQLKLINLTIPLIGLFDILPLPGLSLMCVMKKSA